MMNVMILRHTDMGNDRYVAKPLITLFDSRITGLGVKHGIQNWIGGDQELSFTIEDFLSVNELTFGKGDLAFVYADGSDNPIWAGRVAETSRVWKEGRFSSVNVVARGFWVTLMEHLLDEAVNNPNTQPNVTEPIAYAVRELGISGQIAMDLSDIQYFTTDLGNNAFTFAQYSKYLGDIVKHFVQFGSDDAPPKPAMFLVSGWTNGRMGIRVDSDYDVSLLPPWQGVSVGGGGSYDIDVAASFMRHDYNAAVTEAAMSYDKTMIEKDDYERDVRIRYVTKAKRATSGANAWAGFFGLCCSVSDHLWRILCQPDNAGGSGQRRRHKDHV